MIYLVVRMFVYLVIAGVAGAAAGWLWRHRSALTREEELTRSLSDTRGRIPQLEALMRARDGELRRLGEELDERREAAREAAQQARSAALEVTRLRQELDRALVAQAPEGESAEALRAELATLKRSLDTREAFDDARRSALETRLEEQANGHEQTRRELSRAEERVVELERERELQNRSLKVLHQQIELLRDVHGRAGHDSRESEGPASVA
jgi:chromosome segregation ATPase